MRKHEKTCLPGWRTWFKKVCPASHPTDPVTITTPAGNRKILVREILQLVGQTESADCAALDCKHCQAHKLSILVSLKVQVERKVEWAPRLIQCRLFSAPLKLLRLSGCATAVDKYDLDRLLMQCLAGAYFSHLYSVLVYQRCGGLTTSDISVSVWAQYVELRDSRKLTAMHTLIASGPGYIGTDSPTCIYQRCPTYRQPHRHTV